MLRYLAHTYNGRNLVVKSIEKSIFTIFKTRRRGKENKRLGGDTTGEKSMTSPTLAGNEGNMREEEANSWEPPTIPVPTKNSERMKLYEIDHGESKDKR